LVLIGTVVGLFIVAGLGIWLMRTPSQNPASNAFYVQAEKAFNQGNYQSAITLFDQFLDEYPQHTLASLALAKQEEARVAMIRANELAVQKQAKVDDLFARAQDAMKYQRYTRPENDNVVSFTDSLLALEPGHQGAMKMRFEVADYYVELAAKNMKRYRYSRALDYYEMALEVDPENPQAMTGYDKVNSLMNATGRRQSNKTAYQLVVEVRNQAQENRNLAVNIDAQEATAFQTAEKRFEKAKATMDRSDYLNAHGLFEQASNLYRKAIEIQNRKRRQLAITARNNMQAARAEAERLLAGAFAKKHFDQAGRLDRDAENIFNQSRFAEAVLAFGKAEAAFLEAAREAKQNR
ncbi:MAG: hypothetical protein KDI06_04180, partial [Calditrichaeota bacterium]|nr:hypothetical protein [Calditrichota bacterium]